MRPIHTRDVCVLMFAELFLILHSDTQPTKQPTNQPAIQLACRSRHTEKCNDIISRSSASPFLLLLLLFFSFFFSTFFYTPLLLYVHIYIYSYSGLIFFFLYAFLLKPRTYMYVRCTPTTTIAASRRHRRQRQISSFFLAWPDYTTACCVHECLPSKTKDGKYMHYYYTHIYIYMVHGENDVCRWHIARIELARNKKKNKHEGNKYYRNY